jgi:hypothetical protein
MNSAGVVTTHPATFENTGRHRSEPEISCVRPRISGDRAQFVISEVLPVTNAMAIRAEEFALVEFRCDRFPRATPELVELDVLLRWIAMVEIVNVVREDEPTSRTPSTEVGNGLFLACPESGGGVSVVAPFAVRQRPLPLSV